MGARGDLADLWPLSRRVQLLSSGLYPGAAPHSCLGWMLGPVALSWSNVSLRWWVSLAEGITSEAPAVITACVMDFLLAGAALSFGAGCDVLQWLEKARWFWFGVHQVC